MFGEFNEAAQPKTSLAKYSIEFNDLAVQLRLQYRFVDRLPFTQLIPALCFEESAAKMKGNFFCCQPIYLGDILNVLDTSQC